jgi:hypothetical protein
MVKDYTGFTEGDRALLNLDPKTKKVIEVIILKVEPSHILVGTLDQENIIEELSVDISMLEPISYQKNDDRKKR